MENNSIENAVEIRSIKDGSYQQAKIKGVSESITRGLMRLIPGLGSSDDPFTDEIKTELRDGYMLRWSEINPTVTYVAVENQWVRESEIKNPEKMKAERFELNVYSAFSYTQQAFGALKNEQPQKHAIIKDIRDKFNKFVSNCLNDLKRDAAKIYKADNGITATRSATATFFDWLMTGDKSALSNIRQRAVNAQARGDETVDIKKLDAALAAFKAKMK